MHKYIIHLLAAAFVFGSTGLLVSGAQKKGNAEKKDRKALQGTWTAKKGPISAAMTLRGKKFVFKMQFGEDKITAFGTYTIDPSKSPKTIDMKIEKGKGEKVQDAIGKTALGIYKLDGGALIWCSSEPGKEARPKAFEEIEGQHMLLKFERKKKKKKEQ